MFSDVRQLLQIRQAAAFEKFVRLCAGRVGQLLNLQMEIKSGQTVTRDYFQGLNRFAKVAGDRLTGGAVVYGGDKRQLRSDWEVWPVAELDSLASRAFSLFAD